MCTSARALQPPPAPISPGRASCGRRIRHSGREALFTSALNPRAIMQITVLLVIVARGDWVSGGGGGGEGGKGREGRGAGRGGEYVEPWGVIADQQPLKSLPLHCPPPSKKKPRGGGGGGRGGVGSERQNVAKTCETEFPSSAVTLWRNQRVAFHSPRVCFSPISHSYYISGFHFTLGCRI